MPLPFDATLKDLVKNHLAGWLAILGESAADPTQILVTRSAHRICLCRHRCASGERILHVDFQSGADIRLPRRMLMYNTLLFAQYGLPVHSIVILLHPRVDRSDLTGTVSYEGRLGHGGLVFHFEVLRLWEVPIGVLLQGGLRTLPLAPPEQVPEGEFPEAVMPGAIEQLREGIHSEASPAEAAQASDSGFLVDRFTVSSRSNFSVV